MQRWLKEVNPHALQNMPDKLLEAIQRGMWNTSDAVRRQLEDVYLDVEGDIEEVMDVAQARGT